MLRTQIQAEINRRKHEKNFFLLQQPDLAVVIRNQISEQYHHSIKNSNSQFHINLNNLNYKEPPPGFIINDIINSANQLTGPDRYLVSLHIFANLLPSESPFSFFHTREYKLKENLTRAEVTNIIHKTAFELQANNESQYDIIGIDAFVIKINELTVLRNMVLQATRVIPESFQNDLIQQCEEGSNLLIRTGQSQWLKLLQKNGQCLEDYLIYLLLTDYKTGNTEQMIRKQVRTELRNINKNYQTNSTVGTLIEYAKRNQRISLHIFDVFRNKVMKIPSNHNKPISACCVISNNHILPIIGKQNKDHAIRNDYFDIGKVIVQEHDFTDYTVTKDFEKVVNREIKTKTIVFDGDLRELIAEIAYKHNVFVDKFSMDKNRINLFMWEDKLIVNGCKTFEIRKNIVDTFNKTVKPEHQIQFQNQSYGQLVRMMFQRKQGALPKSNFNMQTGKFFKDNIPKPVSDIYCPKKLNTKFTAIDKCRAYTNLCHKMDFNNIKYRIDDIPEVYNGEEIELGFYLLRNHKSKFNIMLDGFYYYDDIKYFLKHGYITKKDIKYKFIPEGSSRIGNVHFSDFIKFLYDTFSLDDCKMLWNTYTGLLGRSNVRTDRSAIVISISEVMCLRNHYNDHEFNLSWLNKTFDEQLFFVTLTKKQFLPDNNLSIYARIMSASTRSLLEQIEYFSTPKTKVIATKVDLFAAVNIKNKSKLQFKKDFMESLKQKHETTNETCSFAKYYYKHCVLKTQYVLEDTTQFQTVFTPNDTKIEDYKIPKIKDINIETLEVTTENMPESKGILFHGGPGEGKSFYTREYLKKLDVPISKLAITTTSAKNVDSMKSNFPNKTLVGKEKEDDEKISNALASIVQTNSSFFGIQGNYKRMIIISKHKLIIVLDEAPIVCYDHLLKYYRIYEQSGYRICFLGNGDHNQMLPIDEHFKKDLLFSMAFRSMFRTVKFINRNSPRFTDSVLKYIVSYIKDKRRVIFKRSHIKKLEAYYNISIDQTGLQSNLFNHFDVRSKENKERYHSTIRKIDYFITFTHKDRRKLAELKSDSYKNHPEKKEITFKGYVQGKHENQTLNVIPGSIVYARTKLKHKLIPNGSFWKIQSFQNKTVTLQHIKNKDKTITISYNTLSNNFISANSLVYQCFQGDEIPENTKGCIYFPEIKENDQESEKESEKVNKMISARALYVIFSRFQRACDIYVDTNIFKDDGYLTTFPQEDLSKTKFKSVPLIKPIESTIYLITITGKEKTFYYVGKTDCTIDYRLSKHLEFNLDKPFEKQCVVYKHVFDKNQTKIRDYKIEVIQHLVVPTDYDVLRIEDKYIKKYKKMYGDQVINIQNSHVIQRIVNKEEETIVCIKSLDDQIKKTIKKGKKVLKYKANKMEISYHYNDKNEKQIREQIKKEIMNDFTVKLKVDINKKQGHKRIKATLKNNKRTKELLKQFGCDTKGKWCHSFAKKIGNRFLADAIKDETEILKQKIMDDLQTKYVYFIE